MTPVGNGKTRRLPTFKRATGSTIVQDAANGDGAADAEIRVAGIAGLKAVDFV